MDINVEPVTALTIYKGGVTAEEDYARRYPRATVSFMHDWKRAELERFCRLQPAAAHSFMDLQAAWLALPGMPELLVSDMLRPIRQQIELKRRKPTLAAKPGLSMHGLGLAVDYDPANLGIDEKGDPYHWRTFGEFIKGYGWAVHGRAWHSKFATECWHIQYLHYEDGAFSSVSALLDVYRDLAAEAIKGDPNAVVSSIASAMGLSGGVQDARVRAIQRMGGLADDGVIGPKTLEYLGLLNVAHVFNESTYTGDGRGLDVEPLDIPDPELEPEPEPEPEPE